MSEEFIIFVIIGAVFKLVMFVLECIPATTTAEKSNQASMDFMNQMQQDEFARTNQEFMDNMNAEMTRNSLQQQEFALNSVTPFDMGGFDTSMSGMGGGFGL